MNLTRIVLLSVSVVVLGFSYWYHFTDQGELWRINKQIQLDWTKEKNEAETDSEKTQQKEIEKKKQELEQQQKKLEDQKTKLEDEKISAPKTSSRNPLQLTGGYVSGKVVTYVVPKNMRTLTLTIQDRVGRTRDRYTLPNSFISVRPEDRLNIKIR